MKQIGTLVMLLFISFQCSAQTDTVYFKGAIAANRTKQYQQIVNNVINKNLSLNLADSTEANWEQAFSAIEVLQYKSPWASGRIPMAFDSLQKRSIAFQDAALRLAYANYPTEFMIPVQALFTATTNLKIAALCAEYIYRNDVSWSTVSALYNKVYKLKITSSVDSTILSDLGQRLLSKNYDASAMLRKVLNKSFLPGNTVVYSIQRKNRNYPGLAIVRDSSGHFVQLAYGIPAYIPQLARSITGLPYYFIGGNTPQGIYKMDGLDSSASDYIGPTANIQLRVPFETSIADFLNDSTITDSVWTMDYYKKLLPANCKNCTALNETYDAGKIGRTEIIAHGTAVNTNYYIGKSYYPFTPTEGCLCTNETWSDEDGMRINSDELKLVNAIKQTGRTTGYYIVVDIDDQQQPVLIEEIVPYLGGE